MFFQRLAAILLVALGAIGVCGCAAGAYYVWLVSTRLEQANDRVFAVIEGGLGRVQDRLPVVQQRVKDSKVTTAEVAEVVRTWTAKKVQDRVVSKLEIENRVGKLAEQLQAADLRLEASTDTVHDVRRAMEFGQSLGAQLEPASTDRVMDLLASVQGRVQEAEQTVEEVRRLAASDPRESFEDRLLRVATVVARILLTLSDVDQRLEDLANRVAEARSNAPQLKARTSRYITLGAIVCYVILLWAAIGQVALCRWGWSCCRRKG
jgi:chromosome segregation ATPase